MYHLMYSVKNGTTRSKVRKQYFVKLMFFRLFSTLMDIDSYKIDEHHIEVGRKLVSIFNKIQIYLGICNDAIIQKVSICTVGKRNYNYEVECRRCLSSIKDSLSTTIGIKSLPGQRCYKNYGSIEIKATDVGLS